MNRKQIKYDANNDRRMKRCIIAPEWAEHARNYEEMEPCDDGRAGVSCGNRKGEKPCQIFNS